VARILVIDDEPQVRRAICQMLARGGHEALEAADGADGLAVVRAQHPDAVITDLMMPNKEGIETIRELRRAEPHLPILVISGKDEAGLYLEMATLLGAHAALTKPFRSADLLALVARMLAPADRAGPPPTG